MDWTLEQINSFVAAADKGSFSEAARSLGRAQSVVSTHVATLEAELGVGLFDRSGRLPVLTEAGRELLEEAREVLRRCRRFEAKAIARYQGETGTLSMAVGDGVPFFLVTAILVDLARQYPFLRVRLLICPHAEAWQRVEDGDVQLALVYKSEGRRPEYCEGSWVATVDQVIVAPWDHPLAGKSDISPSDLALHRQIVVGDSARGGLRHVMSTHTWETNDLMAALDMAWRGLGWTVLPEPMLHVFQSPPPAHLKPFVPPNPVVLISNAWKLPPASIMLLWNYRYQRQDIVDQLRGRLVEAFRDIEKFTRPL